MTTTMQETNDPLADRTRAAFAKIKGGRATWIEGTLELAAVVKEGRDRFPDHHAFSRWLEQHGLDYISPQNRSALMGMANADQIAMRSELERSTSTSWEMIWKKSALRPLSKNRKGVPRRFSRGSGHADRQRAKRIPTVMQEPYQRLQDLVLTREQVDPDFKGTSQEFSRIHGHVPLHTKAEKEHNKHQDVLQKWLGIVANAARAAEAVSGLPDPATMIDWLAKPGKRARYDGWIYTLETTVARLKACLPPKTLDEIEAEIDAIGNPLQ